ncbi:MAG: hypothetical protein A2X94_11920 [Bdellovibrionales bacterium GWB1_55_8]|nr:MAG: hypothetical protein A2X94_11920 [Bdellovibrionales bacterium GWB1_55_8]
MALRKLKAVPKVEPPRLPPTKPHAAAHDESNWLVSYADMMTLLCGFFIMLFSLAKLDDPQYEKVKEAVAKQFGGDYAMPTDETKKYIAKALSEVGTGNGMQVTADPYGVTIIFESTVFFDTLGTDVKAQGKEVLQKLITAVSERQVSEAKTFRIVVEGHTDSRPVIGGVYPSNWELSGARASSVVRMFLERGFRSDRLIAIGYADTHPASPARNPAGTWDEAALAKNRRVVIRILEPKVDAIPFPDNANVLTSPPATPAH